MPDVTKLLTTGALIAAAIFIGGCGTSDEISVKPGAQAITCMPQPSACQFPDTTNTGVQPGVALTPVNGEVTLSTPGQVLENKLVTGGITVTAPNVTIRNVKLVAEDDNYGIRAFGWQHNVSGLTIDHVEINLNGHLGAKGIAFDGYTARHVYFHNGADCAHFGSDVVIEDSLCVLGPDSNGDGEPDNRSFCGGSEHFDGFQSDGGKNITIRHNTIRNPCSQTSAILLSTNTSPIDGVKIDSNLMSGGGYTAYCGTAEGGPATATTYTNNVISSEYFSKGGYYGATTECDHVTAASGNIWDGSYVPPGPGANSPPPTASGEPSLGNAPIAKLTTVRAARDTKVVLRRKLGRRYTHGVKARKVRCRRRTDTVVVCTVSWRSTRSGVTVDHYRGTVVITRVSTSRTRYAIRVRHSPRGCGCTRAVSRSGSV
jgi:hypothetical protein